MTMNRRKVLQSFLVYFFAGKLLALEGFSHPFRSDGKSVDMPTPLINECKAVHRHWIQVEGHSPVEYLAELGFDNQPKLKKIIQNDFEEHNIFIVGGLVLAKTEAAIIATMGESQGGTI